MTSLQINEHRAVRFDKFMAMINVVYEASYDTIHDVAVSDTTPESYLAAYRDLASKPRKNQIFEMPAKYSDQVFDLLKVSAFEMHVSGSLSKKTARRLCKVLSNLPRECDEEELAEDAIWFKLHQLGS